MKYRPMKDSSGVARGRRNIVKILGGREVLNLAREIAGGQSKGRSSNRTSRAVAREGETVEKKSANINTTQREEVRVQESRKADSAAVEPGVTETKQGRMRREPRCINSEQKTTNYGRKGRDP